MAKQSQYNDFLGNDVLDTKVSDTKTPKVDVSDIVVSEKPKKVDKSKKQSGVKVVYKDGKVISSKPF